MKLITPNETEITGKWIMSQGHIEEDDTCKRITELVQGCLAELGHDESGWDTLYRDTNDGRFWEKIFPKSEVQGGGPPQLRCLSADEARRKYGNVAVIS